MSLGLSTEVQPYDLLVGGILVCLIGLAVEVARLMERKTGMGPKGRFLIYSIASIVLSIAWWISFDKRYFPTTEVVTAVIPQLSHPYLFPWQAPYGYPWVWINQVFWHLGQLFFPFVPSGVDWMLTLTIVNIPFFYLFRSSQLLTGYFMTSFFLWAVVPWDLSILFLLALGFAFQHILARIGFAGLAVLAKIPLPFGSSRAAFQYDFVNGQEYGTLGSALVPGHWMPYFVLAAWALALLLKPYISFLSLTSFYGGANQCLLREREGSSVKD